MRQSARKALKPSRIQLLRVLLGHPGVGQVLQPLGEALCAGSPPCTSSGSFPLHRQGWQQLCWENNQFPGLQ